MSDYPTMPKEAWVMKYQWLIDALVEKYGKHAVKYGTFDLGHEFGIAVDLGDRRTAIRLTKEQP